MSTPLLRIVAHWTIPLQLLLSLYLLLRGHSAPGGGFIAGLVAASAVLLYGLAYSHRQLITRLPLRWFSMVRLGLVIALSSMFPSLLLGKAFLTAVWGPEIWVPFVGNVKLGTVLLFDIGVFVLVTGFGVGLAYCFSEEARGE